MRSLSQGCGIKSVPVKFVPGTIFKINSGIVLSITIDKLRVFINKTLSILTVSLQTTLYILVCSSDKYWCVPVTYILPCVSMLCVCLSDCGLPHDFQVEFREIV